MFQVEERKIVSGATRVYLEQKFEWITLGPRLNVIGINVAVGKVEIERERDFRYLMSSRK